LGLFPQKTLIEPDLDVVRIQSSVNLTGQFNGTFYPHKITERQLGCPISDFVHDSKIE